MDIDLQDEYRHLGLFYDDVEAMLAPEQTHPYFHVAHLAISCESPSLLNAS